MDFKLNVKCAAVLTLGLIIAFAFPQKVSAAQGSPYVPTMASVTANITSPESFPDSAVGILFTNEAGGETKRLIWELKDGAWLPLGTHELMSDEVYILTVEWALGSKAKGAWELLYYNGEKVDGSKIYPLADGVSLTIEFKTLEDVAAIQKAKSEYTPAAMRERYAALREQVAAGWDGWKDGITSHNILYNSGTSLTNEELDALSACDQFLFTHIFRTPQLYLLGGTRNWREREKYLLRVDESMDEYTGKKTEYKNLQSIPDGLNEILVAHHEYIWDFWNDTGLVYEPIEDIFYMEGTVPYTENPAADPNEVIKAEPEPVEMSNADEGIYKGLTADEEKALKKDIQDVLNDTVDSPGKRMPAVVAVLIIAAAIALASTGCVIIYNNRRKTFMSEPPEQKNKK